MDLRHTSGARAHLRNPTHFIIQQETDRFLFKQNRTRSLYIQDAPAGTLFFVTHFRDIQPFRKGLLHQQEIAVRGHLLATLHLLVLDWLRGFLSKPYHKRLQERRGEIQKTDETRWPGAKERVGPNGGFERVGER